MITVATSLDVPIKLVFPHSKRGGMLGLGDVVLPGIVMALALRFDLYLFYLRKTALERSPDMNTKPEYETATGRWGDRFWTRNISKSDLPSKVAAAIFPKTYFYASIVGYIIGMVATMVVLNVFSHAQPALLYLVPSVLIALWGTALFRGELKLMWNYSEAESTDKNENEEKAEYAKDSKDKNTDKAELEEEKEERIEGKKKSLVKNEHAHHVFLLSLSSPRHGTLPGKDLNTT
jgi:minor histocompatibility antigen H13